MTARILVSRNKREGGYLGWRRTGGRNCLNGHCRPINHERAGAPAPYVKGLSLQHWKRQLRQWGRV